MDSQLRMLEQVKLSKIVKSGTVVYFLTGKMIHMQKFDHGLFVNALLCFFFYRIIASSALYC